MKLVSGVECGSNCSRISSNGELRH
jgi:hypothetical protein